MIFSVQRYLEDHFDRRGLSDVDQYAIRLANAFEEISGSATKDDLVRRIGRIRTVFFRRNQGIDRKQFEKQLAASLFSGFKKKSDPFFRAYEASLTSTHSKLRSKRRSIAILLSEFKLSVEAKGIDAFWESRKKHRLRSRPEKIGQALLAVFAKAVVSNNGLVLREIASGIGFVDLGISFGKSLHLIEMKVVTKKFIGAQQLATYMKTEGRTQGWLVLIDARKSNARTTIPPAVKTHAGFIKTVLVDVNPLAPHDA